MYNLFKINLACARASTHAYVCVFIQSIYIMIAIKICTSLRKTKRKNIDKRASVYFGRVGDRRVHRRCPLHLGHRDTSRAFTDTPNAESKCQEGVSIFTLSLFLSVYYKLTVVSLYESTKVATVT